MVKKTYLKTIKKTLTGNISRFLVMSLVVMLGICFIAGIGTLSSSLTDSINEYYNNKQGLDLIIKSKSQTGFTPDEISKIKNNKNISKLTALTSIDNLDTRLIILDFNANNFHNLSIIKGRAIKNDKEILVDRISDIPLNKTITLNEEEYTVVGIVDNPSYYCKEKELSIYEEELNNIYYLDTNYYNNPLKYLKTDLYIKLKDTPENIFSDEYEDLTQDIKKELKKDNPNIEVLTLEENLSYALTKSYGEKIDLISYIFPVFFILVSALVVYSTINRLIEEEREIIGCYTSLGIPKKSIILKYFSFTLITTIIGSILGFIIGINLLPNVIYPAFDALFLMPKMTTYRIISPGIITSVLMIIILSIITIILVIKQLEGPASNLLRPISPTPGKKILLERIPFIWKNLKFKYKSSLRNIFRYKVNLIMTIVSVSGSTALTFAGFGLYAIAIDPDTDKIPLSMANSFALISIVIIIFAALLAILVVFNITNMNIQERIREIATLRVLGYQKKEVSLYIYREINITTFIGALIGLPLGYVLLNFLFEFLEFGDIKNVSWYYYLLTIFLVMLFSIIAEILLNRKIHNIDMNGALKIND